MLHVADGLLPLLEALAAASTAETSRTAGLDVQMVATAADDVLADADRRAGGKGGGETRRRAGGSETRGRGGRSAVSACVPTKRIATRNSPAPSQKRQLCARARPGPQSGSPRVKANFRLCSPPRSITCG